MTPHKILCPVDFSPGSQRALRVAARLARERDAELVVMHAWHVPPTGLGDLPFPAGLSEQIAGEARRGLDAAVQEATAAGVKRVSAKLARGAPGPAIVATVAEDREIGLVVLGTHGRTGLARVVLGSIAEHVVRHAPCSVLVTRLDSEARPFQHALVPIDFSASSRHALDLAAEHVRAGGAGLTLLHALELPAADPGDAEATELARTVDARADQLLAEWSAPVERKATLPVARRTRAGKAGAEILAMLDDDRSFDLVVMGTHGRTGVQRLLGSVAEKVVRHAPCPVLVARHRS